MSCSGIFCCNSNKGYEEIDPVCDKATKESILGNLLASATIGFLLTGIVALSIGTNSKNLSDKEIAYLVISPFIGAAASAAIVATAALVNVICYKTIKCCVDKFC